jgi:hypothetical protein
MQSSIRAVQLHGSFQARDVSRETHDYEALEGDVMILLSSSYKGLWSNRYKKAQCFLD